MGLTEDGRLSPCPATPNCVCSDAADTAHAIAPLTIRGDPAAAWQSLIDHVSAQARFTVMEQRADYLRLEARTRWLRFVDDVEFHWRPERHEIAMRSASRVGHSDLGANRARGVCPAAAGDAGRLAGRAGSPHTMPLRGFAWGSISRCWAARYGFCGRLLDRRS
jgi:uncharacterized protein (DUF1499 family)